METNWRQTAIRFLLKGRRTCPKQVEMVVRMERQGRKDIADRDSISDQRRVDKREKELRNDLGVLAVDTGRTAAHQGKRRRKGTQQKNREPSRTILGIFPFYKVSTVLGISEVKSMFARQMKRFKKGVRRYRLGRKKREIRPPKIFVLSVASPFSLWFLYFCLFSSVH